MCDFQSNIRYDIGMQRLMELYNTCLEEYIHYDAILQWVS